ncbi:hypothetical protein IU487_21365 [Nocardia puris]|nr:hypothetical protein [Nocardia puris]MBF6213569.1 hypothetical protein [Nocardia puris]
MTLPWRAAVVIGAAVFVTSMLRAGLALMDRMDPSSMLAPLLIPASLMLGILLWPLVLELAWIARREFLRRAGTAVDGSVVSRSIRRLRRATGYRYEVKFEVALRHPRTDADQRLAKTFVFPRFFEKRAQSLHDRFPEGARVPLLVRANYGAFDVYERPVWVDIW